MGKVYDTQDYLRIKLTYTDSSITNDIASVKIKYVDPDGIAGEWDALHDTAGMFIYYDVPLSGWLKAGRWTVWSFATIIDGRVIPGEPVKFVIREEGT